jgi:hypothetical protein
MVSMCTIVLSGREGYEEDESAMISISNRGSDTIKVLDRLYNTVVNLLTYERRCLGII